MLDDTEQMEAAHQVDDGRTACPDCGVRVKKLYEHRRAVHGAHSANGPGRPRRDRPPARPAASRPKAGPKSLRVDLEVSLTFVAQMLAFKDPVCGSVALQQVPQIAAAWDAWAKSSPAVYKYLSWLLSGGGAVGVALAHVPLVLVVVQHHGPDRERFFPPPPVEAFATNGSEPPADWQGPPPGYEPAGADRAR